MVGHPDPDHVLKTGEPVGKRFGDLPGYINYGNCCGFALEHLVLHRLDVYLRPPQMFEDGGQNPDLVVVPDGDGRCAEAGVDKDGNMK